MTGTRAEFGLLEPVLRAIAGRRTLSPVLIVTGMHLLKQFGATVRDVRRAGWPIDAQIPMQTGRDDVLADCHAVSRGISGIARALRRLRCEVTVVLGDRIEAFAAASAAHLSRIPVAHIHGGDRATGQTDDALRNAITRLAHVHCVASPDARRRLLRMGEASWRIHRVGAPGLDDIRQALRRAPGQPHPKGPPFALIVQHPATPDPAREYRTMRDILWAVQQCGLRGTIIYPNSDSGHSGILRAIREVRGERCWTTIPSLPRTEYLRLAARASVLVGNSSSGIIESASLGLRVVNIGPRQDGRLRCGPHVIDVPARRAAVLRGLRQALRRPRPRVTSSVYGDGRAGPRIALILERLTIDDRLLRKQLAY